jgi:hypothetical protein
MTTSKQWERARRRRTCDALRAHDSPPYRDNVIGRAAMDSFELWSRICGRMSRSTTAWPQKVTWIVRLRPLGSDGRGDLRSIPFAYGDRTQMHVTHGLGDRPIVTVPLRYACARGGPLAPSISGCAVSVVVRRTKVSPPTIIQKILTIQNHNDLDFMARLKNLSGP